MKFTVINLGNFLENSYIEIIFLSKCKITDDFQILSIRYSYVTGESARDDHVHEIENCSNSKSN